MAITIRRFFVAMLLPCVVGCDDSAAYKRTVANAVGGEPHVQAFEKLFPNSNHFISYFNEQSGQPRWNSEAALHGRYVLTMQFDIAIDRSGATVRALNPPQYFLVEVASITVLPDGRKQIAYEGASQLEFGEAKWKKLEDSGGDLSVLGLKVKKNEPVPNFGTVYPFAASVQ